MILLRSFRFIRIFRIFKLFSFINEGYMLMRSLHKSLTKISVYFLFVLILDICLGTLMYMVESGQPGTQFTDLATSVYWAIVTMTTVGYGDIIDETKEKPKDGHCPRCDAPVRDKDHYCSRCGEKL